jgi:N-acyl-L-homoserine lactone synthetase
MTSSPSGSAAPRSNREPLQALFAAGFAIQTTTTPQLLDAALALRHQAYCIENSGFEDPAHHSEGRETDEFDRRSRHALLTRRDDGCAIGTVRIVLPKSIDDPDFPVQRISSDPAFKDPAHLPPGSSGEISRFTLPKHAARAQGHILPRLGLVRSVVLLSAEARLTHWCATMEPALLRLLAASGVRFKPIGPLIQHHGLRQPCLAAIHAVLLAIRADQPEVYDVITDGGRLSQEFQRPRIASRRVKTFTTSDQAGVGPGRAACDHPSPAAVFSSFVRPTEREMVPARTPRQSIASRGPPPRPRIP